MRLRREGINSFPLPAFHRLGILCCRRVAHLTRDKRLAKALQTFERSVGPPFDERLRRDARNAANTVYVELSRKHGRTTVEASVACTLVCACESFANANLLGNFESALTEGELLTTEAVRKIVAELIEEVEDFGKLDK